MGTDLLFIVSVLMWLGLFFYLLVLHLKQRKLTRIVDKMRLTLTSEPADEERRP